MSSSNVDAILPFNKLNNAISKSDLDSLLLPYGHDGVINDINLFRKAFVHRSYVTRKNESFMAGNVNCPIDCLPLQSESLERLEFLGDSVLGVIIARYMFERFPNENEGFLSQMRVKLVNGIMLAHLASLLDLGRFVIISKQIEENEGRASKRILEDCFEAFLGAIFLDSGSSLEKPTIWLIGLIEQNIDFSDLIVANNNFKDRMLKHYQQTFGFMPRFYDQSCEKKGLVKNYTICAKDKNDVIIGKGTGLTKKLAENDCSKNILDSIGI